MRPRIQERTVGPDFQPDVPLIEVFLYGIFNPATIVVAFLLGQRADDKSKIILAAFAGAAAGVALLYVVTLLRLWDAPTLARAVAGVFITSLIAGCLYAGAGYLMRGRTGGEK
jgi:ABC-type Fe3+-siderophore transport system permease subunit